MREVLKSLAFDETIIDKKISYLFSLTGVGCAKSCHVIWPQPKIILVFWSPIILCVPWSKVLDIGVQLLRLTGFHTRVITSISFLFLDQAAK